jgi:hypothetical protein
MIALEVLISNSFTLEHIDFRWAVVCSPVPWTKLSMWSVEIEDISLQAERLGSFNFLHLAHIEIKNIQCNDFCILCLIFNALNCLVHFVPSKKNIDLKMCSFI